MQLLLYTNQLHVQLFIEREKRIVSNQFHCFLFVFIYNSMISKTNCVCIKLEKVLLTNMLFLSIIHHVI